MSTMRGHIAAIMHEHARMNTARRMYRDVTFSRD
jgi:hypothetical protein